MRGNKLLNLTITGNTTDLTLSLNVMNRMTLDGNDNTRITLNSNELSITGGATQAMQINGNMYECSVVGNNSRQGFRCVGNFTSSVFTGNKMAFETTGIVWEGSLTRSVISSNVGESNMRVQTNVSTSIISNNQVRSIQINGTLINSNIVNNIISRVTNGPSIEIEGNITASVIMGNSGNEYYLFGAEGIPIVVNESNIDHNVINQGSIQVIGTMVHSSLNNNFATGDISTTAESTTSSFTNNRCDNILIDTINNANSSENSIIGNVLATGITIGSSGVGGISANLVNNNIAPTSITTVLSSNTNNIITGNRCSSIAGFGGTDIIDANI